MRIRMVGTLVMADYVSIPAEPSTRDRIKGHLRGGERYDDLLQRMLEAYTGEAGATE